MRLHDDFEIVAHDFETFDGYDPAAGVEPMWIATRVWVYLDPVNTPNGTIRRAYDLQMLLMLPKTEEAAPAVPLHVYHFPLLNTHYRIRHPYSRQTFHTSQLQQVHSRDIINRFNFRKHVKEAMNKGKEKKKDRNGNNNNRPRKKREVCNLTGNNGKACWSVI